MPADPPDPGPPVPDVAKAAFGASSAPNAAFATSPRRDRIPRGAAAGLGITSVALAVGTGHLAAALVAPAASPPLAVAAAVVRLAPLPLVEFATATFGTADKPVLLAGIGVVLAGVAALAGLAARRAAWPAVAVVVALGLLAGAAAWTAPSFAQLDLLPQLVATAAGVWAVRWLHPRLPRAGAAPSNPPRDAVADDESAPQRGRRRGRMMPTPADVAIPVPSRAAVSSTAPPRSASSVPPRSWRAGRASCSAAGSATPAPR